jgi:hypothetical protein
MQIMAFKTIKQKSAQSKAAKGTKSRTNIKTNIMALLQLQLQFKLIELTQVFLNTMYKNHYFTK